MTIFSDSRDLNQVPKTPLKNLYSTTDFCKTFCHNLCCFFHLMKFVFCSEGILFGMGNPLLDISAKVGSAYLQK